MKSKKATKRALLSSALSLVLCFSMLLGTTFAWFTDEAKTGVNTIQAGTLNVDLTDANGNSISGDGQSIAFKNMNGNDDILWEPGVTFVTDGFKVVNEGNLALKYKVVVNGVSDGSTAELLEVIDFYVTTVDPANYNNNLAGYETAIAGNKTDLYDFVSEYRYLAPEGETMEIKGESCKDKSEVYYLVGHMDEDAGNEYQNKQLTGLGITVYATQVEAEFDSFGNDYDGDALPDALPIAYVEPLMGDELNINAMEISGGTATPLTLDAGYKFVATETVDEAAASPYRWWHADFVVSADHAVPANSVTLAGYYSAFCDLAPINGNWIALSASADIPANEEIRLVSNFANVAYKEVCNYGYDNSGFQCGIVALNPEAVAGTTVTVELRLYEVENADSDSGSHNVEVVPENYVTIGKYEYTFPVTPVEVANQEALNDALANSASDVVAVELAAGTYTLPSAINGKTVTISGTEETKISVESGLNYINGADVTFEGVTIQSEPEGEGYKNGFADAKSATFNNCVIDGTLGLDFSCEFNDCTFNISGNYYNVWTWGAGTATFKGCTFNCDGKALLVYANVLDNGTNHQTVNITDCVFNDNGDDTVTGKAAIEITNTYTPVRTYDVIINNTTVNGFAQTVPGAGDFNVAYGSVEGSDIGTNVWGNKCKLPNTQINVVIDGVDVY